MTEHRLALPPAELAEKARRLRCHVARMVAPIGEGCVGQGLGAADIMAALYFHEMAYDPEDPAWEGRDRFLLSPAHDGVALFAALAERGALPVQELAQYGVEATLGSLGMGLSVGVADVFAEGAGAPFLFRTYGLSADAIADRFATLARPG